MSNELWPQLSKISPENRRELLTEVRRRIRVAESRRKLWTLFPDEGPLRRELYKKHLEFFHAGATHQERAIVGANRSGKTMAGGYELTLHLLGEYPDWWEGRRFNRPVVAWASGEDAKAVRESLQVILLGPPNDTGTGLIPGDSIIGKPTARAGVPEAIDSANVRHKDGGTSRLTFKCFAAGTSVKMADGTVSRIQDVRLWDRVLCADGTSRSVTEVHAYAKSPLLRIETRSGAITVTPNHKMYLEGSDRAREAKDLTVGAALQIACPEIEQSVSQEDWRVKLTALMIGDGCTRAKTPFFTCAEPEIVAAVEECLPTDMYLVPVKAKKRQKPINFKIASHGHKLNRLKESLVADGLWGILSKRKHIPGWVFRLPTEQKRIFVRWLYGCDGSIKTQTANYTSASYRLAHDLRLLLWDLGMPTKVREHLVKLKDKKFLSYYLSLTGENRQKFQSIGKLNRVVDCLKKPRPKGHVGEILSITRMPDDNSFCVTVEHAHELIAEGYRVGNSYDQGRESFQAAKVDVVMFDEEPPEDVYSEGLTRTISTVPGEENGLVICTFTPLSGISNVVQKYLPGGIMPGSAAEQLKHWGWA